MQLEERKEERDSKVSVGCAEKKDIQHDSALTKVKAKEKEKEKEKEKGKEEDIKDNVGCVADGATQLESVHTRANHSVRERAM